MRVPSTIHGKRSWQSTRMSCPKACGVTGISGPGHHSTSVLAAAQDFARKSSSQGKAGHMTRREERNENQDERTQV
ncbi:hypothetical protein OIU77_005350 [Salix suchowensis]|uniref:Uncharacterized protein n=1 Tax=Salix suchowensis TaxID=1278906 RepID=A0ABQ9AP32_9ROSI|nr:hypothetical protein OIU77_005350 [Salix suchowensis]